MPWVTLKIAASLDGRTAMANGESQWITSEEARQDAHRLRASSSAIITGIGTVLRDDPQMTARTDDVSRQPLRVILDRRLSTPEKSRILESEGDVLIMTSPEHVAEGEIYRQKMSRLSDVRCDMVALILWQRCENSVAEKSTV